MDILYNTIPLSVYRLPQTDDSSRVYQCVNFSLHLAACVCSYTASISHSLFGCPCTFHHGPTPWTRKTLRTDSSKWGKISAGSMHRSRWGGGGTKKCLRPFPPWKTEITIRIPLPEKFLDLHMGSVLYCIKLHWPKMESFITNKDLQTGFLVNILFFKWLWNAFVCKNIHQA